jgi:hypothetical protein
VMEQLVSNALVPGSQDACQSGGGGSC